MAPRPRQDFDLETLSDSIPAIFDQAQSSSATHKKNCVALHKLQVASGKIQEHVEGRGSGAELKLVGERAFGEVVLDMVNRVLVVKKSTPAAERIVKFLGSYVRYLNEKDGEEDESPISRFLMRLLRHLLKGFQAKSKDVRFRCLGLVSEIISNLGELDAEMYTELKTALVERLSDKEHLVRAHAVTSLCKLAASEDVDDLDGDEEPIVMSVLRHLFEDPAPEVRRAALVHLPFSPTTLPALLTRMRDVDALTRKIVFTTILPRLDHPRLLTIGQREQIVSHGLGERTDAVRVAAAHLLGSWVDSCEGDLASFLSLFDVHTPDVARDALKSVFVTRAEIIHDVEFDDNFWSALTPEKALLAGTFVEHCIDTKDEKRLESTLPVVTALAFCIQKAFNNFVTLLQEDVDDEDEKDDQDIKSADTEFVLRELLRMALHLDYTDEIGRRKMFGIIREMIAHPQLPESLISPGISILHVMSPNERDLIRLVVEVISELRDKPTEDETFSTGDISGDESMLLSTRLPRSRSRKKLDDMTPEEKEVADLTDIRCLSLFIATLELMHGSFEENSSLEGVLADLVIPSVKRKEIILREKGLVSLGLCCLVAKNLALNSFQLFFSQVQSSPESLRIQALQTIFDIMMTYEKEMMGGDDPVGNKAVPYLMQILEAEESKSVQALICLGLSKLMLFGLCTDERVLICLVIAYISPMTATNQELRQCLAYFLPLYCYTSPVNQSLLKSVFMQTYDLALSVYEELEEGENMISPLQLGHLLIDWTDASKRVGIEEGSTDFDAVHVELASDLLKALYNNERGVEDRKTLCQFLGKLVFPAEADKQRLYTVYIMVQNLLELCPFDDTATDKLFLRFKARFEKHFAPLLVDYSEKACFEDENNAYEEVFAFLGISRPRNRKFEGSTEPETTTRRSRTRELSQAPSEVESEAPSRPKPDRRLSAVAEMNEESDASSTTNHGNEGSSSDEEAGAPVESRSKRAASKASAPPASEAEDESIHQPSEEESDDDREPTPKPTTPRKIGRKRLHHDTPTKSPSMASPPHKRTNRATATASASNRSKKAKNAKAPSPEPEHEPPEPITTRKATSNGSGPAKTDSTKASTTSTKAPSRASSSRGRGRGRGRGRASSRLSSSRQQQQDIASASEDDNSDQSSTGSQDSMPQQRRVRTTTKSRHSATAAPRRMDEEKVGWGDSDDF